MIDLPLSIRTLLEFNIFKDSIIKSGKNSLDNEILWIDIMELLEDTSCLQKGEFLIISDYNLDSENLHKNLILDLYLKEVSGLAIQTDYYLSEIPKYIINDSNKYNLPLIELPAKTNFAAIAQAILRDSYGLNIKYYSGFRKNRSLLENLKIDKAPNLKEKLQITQKLNLNSNSYLCIFVLSVKNIHHNFVPKRDTLAIINQISNYFYLKELPIILENFDDKIVFLISSQKELIPQNLTEDLLKILNNICEIQQELSLLIGASNIFKDISRISNAYNEACSSHAVLEKVNTHKGICFFKYIELFKALYLINSNEHTIKFLYEKIKPLVEYDKIHKTTYFDTFKCFLNNDCNINITSEKLYIHRHTLSNRLEKIKELFHIDLGDTYSKLTFSIAIYLYDFFI